MIVASGDVGIKVMSVLCQQVLAGKEYGLFTLGLNKDVHIMAHGNYVFYI